MRPDFARPAFVAAGFFMARREATVPRYVTHRDARPRADWADFGDSVSRINTTVFEQDDEPQPTGLLNANGDELYRVQDRPRMGFDLKAKA